MTAPANESGAQVAGLENLDERHRKMLVEESAIDPAVVAERGYCTVRKKVDLKAKGFSRDQQDTLVPREGKHGLLAPICWPHVSEPPFWVLQPDRPRVNKRGKKVKYEMPSGCRMALDSPPRCHHDLANPNVPLWITEGQKKGCAGASRGLCMICLIGTWNWRGSNELGGKTALPEWEDVALNDRKVYLVFDSDVMQKMPVYKALSRLRGWLKQRGADVWVVYLPSGSGGEKVGLDDWFAAEPSRGIDDLVALAEKELRKPPEEMSEHRKVIDVLNDAPAHSDLVVPLGYELGPGGVVQVREIIGRDEEDVRETRTQIAPRPIFLAGILDDVSGPGRRKRFVVAYRYRDEWIREVVDRGVALDARRLVHRADGGMPVTSGRTAGVVEYLADFESANLERLPCARVSSQLGWQPGGGFLLGKDPVS